MEVMCSRWPCHKDEQCHKDGGIACRGWESWRVAVEGREQCSPSRDRRAEHQGGEGRCRDGGIACRGWESIRVSIRKDKDDAVHMVNE